jgi:hypothetical protein
MERKMNLIKKSILVLSFLVILVTVPNMLGVSAQQPTPEPIRKMKIIWSYFEDLDIQFDLKDLGIVRHKNYKFVVDEVNNICIQIHVDYWRENLKFRVFGLPDCLEFVSEETPWSSKGVFDLGSEYETAAMLLYEAVSRNEGLRQSDVTHPELLRLGLLHFLVTMFPNNQLYAEQLEKWVPTSTPTATLTPTPTTPTVTLTPTSTVTTTPTVKPTAIPTNTPVPIVIVAEPPTPPSGLPEWLEQLGIQVPFFRWILGLLGLAIVIGLVIFGVFAFRRQQDLEPAP